MLSFSNPNSLLLSSIRQSFLILCIHFLSTGADLFPQPYKPSANSFLTRSSIAEDIPTTSLPWEHTGRHLRIVPEKGLAHRMVRGALVLILEKE